MSERKLFVDYTDDFKDFGTVCNLDSLTEADLRAALREWLEVGRHSRFNFIVKQKEGVFHLVSLDGDFEIRDAKSGAVLLER